MSDDDACGERSPDEEQQDEDRFARRRRDCSEQGSAGRGHRTECMPGRQREGVPSLLYAAAARNRFPVDAVPDERGDGRCDRAHLSARVRPSDLPELIERLPFDSPKASRRDTQARGRSALVERLRGADPGPEREHTARAFRQIAQTPPQARNRLGKRAVARRLRVLAGAPPSSRLPTRRFRCRGGAVSRLPTCRQGLLARNRA
jgi:hypothetical protein